MPAVYAHENGCQWDSLTCVVAAGNGHLHCLRYAREHGCEWDQRLCAGAANGKHLHCQRYAHENGCMSDGDNSSGAIKSGMSKCPTRLANADCPQLLVQGLTTFNSAAFLNLNV